MAETRPKDYPQLENYTPSRFMLPTSHYDKSKADRAVAFIEKANGQANGSGCCRGRNRLFVIYSAL